jgi:hypothetical protein
MWDWLERWQQRQHELQQGVDADLVRANRRRWKLSWSLFAASFLLIGIQAKVNLSNAWREVALCLFMACLGGALVLGHWARAEQAFLDHPDPKKPPKLWKF